MSEADKAEIKKIYMQIIPGVIAFASATLLIHLWGVK